MKKIDLEAHFNTQELIDALFGSKSYPRYEHDPGTQNLRLWYTADTGEPMAERLLNKLLDLEDVRLKNMDAAGIDVQCLSMGTPGVERLEPALGSALAKSANTLLSKAIGKHPDRFIGLATLAPKNPMAAADELERTVKELGFIGWKTNSNYGDSYLDEKKYWPILERAEKLNAFIYLHPTVPSIRELNAYGYALGGPGFGFGVETAMVMMRLVYSGAFDKYPGLKVVLGHLGEGLPFLIKRIDFAYERPWIDPSTRPNLAKRPSDYLKENMYVTTSGNYFKGAFQCTCEAVGIDRILLATDYPYEDSDECIRFVEGLPITQTEKEKIYYLNARKFGIV
jgi:predicted TIM-barrel fold metal-dependent hydrolase